MKKNQTAKQKGLIVSFMEKAAVLLLLVLFVTCAKETSHHDHTYTCSMHPTVISNEPGKCPICGMELVLAGSNGEEHSLPEGLSSVRGSADAEVLASIKTIRGEFKILPVKYEAQGIVTYDTRNIFTISSRVSGRIEKAFLKFPNQAITKGQKVVEIYSAELITAQRELQYLLENDATNHDLIDASKRKLLLLGMSEAEINRLNKERSATNTISIYSPYSGYVIANDTPPTIAPENAAAKTPASGMDDRMSGTPASGDRVGQRQAATVMIKEGNYVNSGETLYKIVNNSSLRVELDLPASQSGTVKKGDQLHLDFGSGIEQVGTIDFVQPFFNNNQDFMKVRVITSDLHGLHVGHLLRATITSDSIQSMWLPREAVLDLGKSRVIFIKDKDTFKPKEIQTGIASGDSIQVTSGLTTADEVASNAQFLVDSESTIKR